MKPAIFLTILLILASCESPIMLEGSDGSADSPGKIIPETLEYLQSPLYVDPAERYITSGAILNGEPPPHNIQFEVILNDDRLEIERHNGVLILRPGKIERGEELWVSIGVTPFDPKNYREFDSVFVFIGK